MAKINNTGIFSSVQDQCKLKTTDTMSQELFNVVSPVVNVLPRVQMISSPDIGDDAFSQSCPIGIDTYLTFVYCNADALGTDSSVSFTDSTGLIRTIRSWVGLSFMDFGDKGILMKEGTTIVCVGMGSAGITFYQMEKA
jgi:hypothetical protein